MIQKRGFPLGDLQLKFDGRLLEDGCLLSDYSIQNGAIVTFNYVAGKVAIKIPFSYSLLIRLLRSQPSKF